MANKVFTVILCVVAVALAVFRIHAWYSEKGLSRNSVTTVQRIDPEAFYDLTRGGHRVGPEDAPVTMVVFGTYSCGKCAAFQPVIDSVRAKYPEHFAVVHRTYVPILDRNDGSIVVHIAAECAADQDKFEDYNRAAYADAGVTTSQSGWLAIGKAVGIPDLASFERCARSRKYLSHLVTDAKAGTALNVPATPTSFINGRGIIGTMSVRGLDSIVATDLRGPIVY